MRSEGDESGIAYWKRKGRVIFKEEMFSMGAILMKLAVFLKENVSRRKLSNFDVFLEKDRNISPVFQLVTEKDRTLSRLSALLRLERWPFLGGWRTSSGFPRRSSKFRLISA